MELADTDAVRGQRFVIHSAIVLRRRVTRIDHNITELISKMKRESKLNQSSFLRGRALELLIVSVTLFGGYRDCFAEGGNSPRLFAPGVVSSPADDLSPAFAPDGKSVYFTRANPSASTIVMSTLAHGSWSTPTVASFSGQWSDLEPAMAPDGSFLIFASNRPSIGRQQALDGNYNGKSIPGGGGNLWRVDHRGREWGTPMRLPDTINHGSAVF